MLKDPNHTDQTAYELLGLPFDTPLPDVRDALKRFMREQGRKNPHLLGAAQQAQKKLQSAAGRAELDIWLYDMKITGDVSEPAKALDLDDFSRPRALEPSQLYCALTVAHRDAPRREITPQEVKFSDVRSFDNIESFRLTPQFDH